MSALILATFYAAMAITALVVEFLFQNLGLIPSQHTARVVEASITFTTVLNIVFLILAALLLARFFKPAARRCCA